MDEERMDVDDCGYVELPIRTSEPHRGIAVIAVFPNFKNNEPGPIKADKDVKLMEDGFKKLQYAVLVWKDENFTKDMFLERLKKIASHKIHQECETFALAIYTHGNEKGKLRAYNTDFCLSEVLNIFKAENCKGLKNKLKFFIFHACCGGKHGEGCEVGNENNRGAQAWNAGLPETQSKDNSTDKKTSHEEIEENKYLCFGKLEQPIEKDYLILFSTFEGNLSYVPKIDKQPSAFIADLISVMEIEPLKMESSRKHILKILTDVLQKTASREFKTNEGGGKKQQPTIIMTLTHPYVFMDKLNISEEELRNISASVN